MHLQQRLQPHKGSSETIDTTAASDTSTSFNPTRVRLKQLASWPSSPTSDRLQPHKGSSETRSFRSGSRVRRPLQPHKGSSETRAVSQRAKRARCFNPTRVRLKLFAIDPFASGSAELQPHKGSSETLARSAPAYANPSASTPQGFV